MKVWGLVRGRSSSRRSFWNSASRTTAYSSIIEGFTAVAASISHSKSSLGTTVSWSRSNLRVWSPYSLHFKEGM